MYDVMSAKKKSPGQLGWEVRVEHGGKLRRIDIKRKDMAFEHRSLDVSKKTYKGVGGAPVNKAAIRSAVKSKMKNQIAPTVDLLHATGDTAKRETLLIRVNGLDPKNKAAQLREVREAAREVAQDIERTTGKKIAIGVIDPAHPNFNTNVARKTQNAVQKTEDVAHDVSKLTHGPAHGLGIKPPHTPKLPGVSKIVKPLAKVAGGAMKVMDVMSTVDQTATLLDPNASEEERLKAGMNLAADVLQKSPNPVVRAFGTGVSIGNTLEDELHVSEVNSRWGLEANASIREAGFGETTALVGGAVVTIVTTPAALAVAAYDKVNSWFE
jgi:hypothetical protein